MMLNNVKKMWLLVVSQLPMRTKIKTKIPPPIATHNKPQFIITRHQHLKAPPRKITAPKPINQKKKKRNKKKTKISEGRNIKTTGTLVSVSPL